MATKKSATKQLLKRVDNIKTTAKNINAEILKTSDNIVDESLATGKEWQKIFAKALQNGTVIFGKQQDLFIETVASVKKQYDNGSTRFIKLLGIEETIDFTIKKAKSTVEAAIAEVKAIQAGPAKAVKTTKSKAKKAAKKTVKKAVAEIENVKKEVLTAMPAKTPKVKAKKATKKAVKKVVAKAAPAKAKIKKAVKTVKKAAPKAAKITKTVKKTTPTKTRKITVKATIATNDDLTQVTGIGPKLASILNNAGIYTFKLLAATDLATLKSILQDAGTRYAKFDPKPWRAQAKKLAKK